MYQTNKPDTFINKNYANQHNVTRHDFEVALGNFDQTDNQHNPVLLYSQGGQLVAWHNVDKDWGFRPL